MTQAAMYLEWTPAEPGDEDQGYSFGTFTDTAEGTDTAARLRAEGRTVRVVSDPAQIEELRVRRIKAYGARQQAKLDAAARIANAPVADGGATMHYPQDRYPYVVVRVSATGAKVTLAPVRPVDATTGHKPAGQCNGFPVWDHTYTSAELRELREPHTITAYRRKNGRYYSRGGSRITFDAAVLYRNYAD